MASVSIAYFKGVLDYLFDLKVDKARYQEYRSLIQDRDVRIGLEQYIDLLNLGAQYSSESLFGFKLGQQIQASDYGVLGYLIESCENLSQAITTLMRFDALVADIGTVSMNESNGVTTIEWQPLHHDCKQMVLRNTTAWVTTVRKILGQTLSPDKVFFTFYLSAQEVTTLNEWFCCDVIGNAKTNSISFPTSFLSIPFTGVNQAMYRALSQVSENEMLQTFESNDLKQRITMLLSARSTLTGCDQKRIADALCTTTRSLQRKLKAENTSYLTLLTQERQSRVKILLTQHSIADTALLLGFKEQSSFTHAFKKWFGVSPSYYQKNLNKKI